MLYATLFNAVAYMFVSKGKSGTRIKVPGFKHALGQIHTPGTENICVRDPVSQV